MYPEREQQAADRAVIGFRTWLLDGDHLASTYMKDRWEPSADKRAACDSKAGAVKHAAGAAPVPTCRCGIYAFHELPPPPEDPRSSVVGAVQLWGRLLVHPTGTRAEWARIAVLARPVGPPDVVERLERLARRYGVPIVECSALEIAALEYGSPPLEDRPLDMLAALETAYRSVSRRHSGLSLSMRGRALPREQGPVRRVPRLLAWARTHERLGSDERVLRRLLWALEAAHLPCNTGPVRVVATEQVAARELAELPTENELRARALDSAGVAPAEADVSPSAYPLLLSELETALRASADLGWHRLLDSLAMIRFSFTEGDYLVARELVEKGGRASVLLHRALRGTGLPDPQTSDSWSEEWAGRLLDEGGLPQEVTELALRTVERPSARQVQKALRASSGASGLSVRALLDRLGAEAIPLARQLLADRRVELRVRLTCAVYIGDDDARRRAQRLVQRHSHELLNNRALQEFAGETFVDAFARRRLRRAIRQERLDWLSLLPAPEVEAELTSLARAALTNPDERWFWNALGRGSNTRLVRRIDADVLRETLAHPDLPMALTLALIDAGAELPRSLAQRLWDHAELTPGRALECLQALWPHGRATARKLLLDWAEGQLDTWSEPRLAAALAHVGSEEPTARRVAFAVVSDARAPAHLRATALRALRPAGPPLAWELLSSDEELPTRLRKVCEQAGQRTYTHSLMQRWVLGEDVYV